MKAETSLEKVLIGICTYRRPELATTLSSLEHLDPCGLLVSVAIADNDAMPSAQSLVGNIASKHHLPIIYLHAPESNIAVARNALLDHARATGARLLVYLDDDETVEPAWLKHLVMAWRNSAAGAVLGPVHACYQSGAPAWMVACRAHDTLPIIGGDAKIISGYTGNTLIDLANSSTDGLCFDPLRGRSGGEDSAFFTDFLAAGGRIVFAPEAIAHETVSVDRAQMAWLLRRRYRMGQTHASLIVSGRSLAGRFSIMAVAAAKALACCGIGLVNVMCPARRNYQLMRAALHIGVIAHLGGAHPIELYGTIPMHSNTSVHPRKTES